MGLGQVQQLAVFGAGPSPLLHSFHMVVGKESTEWRGHILIEKDSQ